MIVMILENVSAGARGELSRWLIEPHPGVFVGHVSGMVRDKLWEKCCKSCRQGGVIQLWSTNNEQHYQIRMYGEVKRKIVELEGLQLVSIPSD